MVRQPTPSTSAHISLARHDCAAVAIVSLIVALLSISAAPALAQLGPLHIAERNPIYALSYSPAVFSAELATPGEFAWEIGTTYSNIFEYESKQGLLLNIDMERMVNELVLRYGVHPRVDVGVRIGARTDWGGVLDGPIQTFHSAFDLPNGDREKVEQGLVTLRLESGSETRLMHPGADGDLEDLQILSRVRIIGDPEGPRRLIARGVVTLPTGGQRTSTGGLNAAFDLIGMRSLGSWHLHGQGGLIRFNPVEELQSFARRPLAWSAAFGIEREVAEGWSIGGQTLFGSPYYSGFREKELDRPPINVGLGAIHQTDSGWRIEGFFLEDFPGNNPSVDVTLGLRISR